MVPLKRFVFGSGRASDSKVTSMGSKPIPTVVWASEESGRPGPFS